MRKKNKKTGILNKVYEDFKIRQKNNDKKEIKLKEELIKKNQEKIKLIEKEQRLIKKKQDQKEDDLKIREKELDLKELNQEKIYNEQKLCQIQNLLLEE